MSNQIEILDFERHMNYVSGAYGMPDPEGEGYMYQPFAIMHGELKEWAYETGQLEYLYDFYDPRENNGHGQESGHMDSEYWIQNLGPDDIYNFLCDQINKKIL